MTQLKIDFMNVYQDDFDKYRNTLLGMRAQRFDLENPHVYELVKRFASEVRSRGYTRYSINSLFERVRWHTDIETTDRQFKLSNNHRAYYARKLMACEGRFEGFFNTREIT